MFARIWTRHRFLASLGAAAAVHGLLLLFPGDRSVTANEQLIELDLLFETQDGEQDWAGLPARGATGSVGVFEGTAATSAHDREQPANALVRSKAEASVVETAHAIARPESRELRLEKGHERAAVGAQKQKPVRLFPGPSQLGSLVRLPPPPTQVKSETASVDERLAAALAPSDTGHGSPASPVVSAGYRAAQLAPKFGTAVFEVRVDRHGRVVAVRVLGAAQGGVWSNVAANLQGTLKGKTFRVREGALGMTIRLRIDRGKFKRAPNQIRPLGPGVAIGQESPSFAYDEASQASKERGGSVPSLGISSDWLHTTVATEIQVLSVTML